MLKEIPSNDILGFPAWETMAKYDRECLYWAEDTITPTLWNRIQNEINNPISKQIKMNLKQPLWFFLANRLNMVLEWTGDRFIVRDRMKSIELHMASQLYYMYGDKFIKATDMFPNSVISTTKHPYIRISDIIFWELRLKLADHLYSTIQMYENNKARTD